MPNWAEGTIKLRGERQDIISSNLKQLSLAVIMQGAVDEVTQFVRLTAQKKPARASRLTHIENYLYYTKIWRGFHENL